MRRLTLLLLAAVLALAAPAHARRSSWQPVLRFPQDEVSGLTPSMRHPGVYWAIQDSADEPRDVLLAVRVEGGQAHLWPDGQLVRTLPVRGGHNHDWEEVAADGQGNLWIADTGNNDEDRDDLALLRVPEPDPFRDRQARVAERVPIRYPDQPHWGASFDAEALFFWQGRGYLVTKTAAHGLYRLPASRTGQGPAVLERLGRLTPPARGFEGLVTGAALSHDGQRLAVTAGRRRAWIYGPGRPAARAGEDPIAALTATPPRWTVPYAADHRATWQVEAVCFPPGTHDVLVAAEEGPLWHFPAFLHQSLQP